MFDLATRLRRRDPDSLATFGISKVVGLGGCAVGRCFPSLLGAASAAPFRRGRRATHGHRLSERTLNVRRFDRKVIRSPQWRDRQDPAHERRQKWQALGLCRLRDKRGSLGLSGVHQLLLTRIFGAWGADFGAECTVGLIAQLILDRLSQFTRRKWPRCTSRRLAHGPRAVDHRPLDFDEALAPILHGNRAVSLNNVEAMTSYASHLRLLPRGLPEMEFLVARALRGVRGGHRLCEHSGKLA